MSSQESETDRESEAEYVDYVPDKRNGPNLENFIVSENEAEQCNELHHYAKHSHQQDDEADFILEAEEFKLEEDIELEEVDLLSPPRVRGRRNKSKACICKLRLQKVDPRSIVFDGKQLSKMKCDVCYTSIGAMASIYYCHSVHFHQPEVKLCLKCDPQFLRQNKSIRFESFSQESRLNDEDSDDEAYHVSNSQQYSQVMNVCSCPLRLPSMQERKTWSSSRGSVEALSQPITSSEIVAVEDTFEVYETEEFQTPKGNDVQEEINLSDTQFFWN